MEKVRVGVKTSGYADKVVIRFSPELESMQFTDAYGNAYDYQDKVGYIVNFPGDSTINLDSSIKDNQVYWEYILPIAPSTKSWDDNVIKGPYWMEVVAYKGGYSVTARIEDISVTGTTYELIYIQPSN